MTDTAEKVETGRVAAARFAWAEAYDAYAVADSSHALGPDDLDRMAESAWWLGKMRDSIALRERAHAGYLESGNRPAAARMAARLAEHHGDLGEGSIATAWLNRGMKLLENEPESGDHALLKLTAALLTRNAMELEQAEMYAAEACDIAARHGDKDRFALGLGVQGCTLVFRGEVDRGMPLIEEATVAAVSGDVGPYATGQIYCMMISATAQLADWQRAGQWTEAAKRWCERQAINGFPGVCRVHRAEIMRLRGSLSEAEEEARAATAELGSFNLFFTALAFKELGEIRLRMGDIDAAEEAFRQAHEMGLDPQPGLALAQIQRGKPQAAAQSLKRALADEHLLPLDRVKLLPTQLEVALALADTATARAIASELAEIAAGHKSPALQAAAEAGAAAVALADGEIGAAESAAKRARRIYKETDLTYEAARASLLLGEIYRAEGDTEGAQYEISSALSTFERIGAIPDADRARALLGTLAQPATTTGRRVAKTFLFSDIVKSTNLLDAIGDDAWTDLLAWHDDTLRKLFAAHGGEEVTHTGDGFFIAFENADKAVACAIEIQRSLSGHRRAHGFAPQVRIGLHATDASEVQGNYHGKGVHEAARIGALAEGGEILASVSTIECLESAAETSDERTVTLKGVAEPVRVVSVSWREA